MRFPFIFFSVIIVIKFFLHMFYQRLSDDSKILKIFFALRLQPLQMNTTATLKEIKPDLKYTRQQA